MPTNHLVDLYLSPFLWNCCCIPLDDLIVDSHSPCVTQVCSDDNSFSLDAAQVAASEKAMLDADCHDDTPGASASPATGTRNDFIAIVGKSNMPRRLVVCNPAEMTMYLCCIIGMLRVFRPDSFGLP